jgi:hypothetical protein
MSELLTPFGIPPDAIEEPTGDLEVTPAVPEATEPVTRTPVMITEQEVVFATAAAVPLQPARPGRRWTDVVGAALRLMFTTRTAEPRPRRHYPPRNDYLESSRMAREMHRL